MAVFLVGRRQILDQILGQVFRDSGDTGCVNITGCAVRLRLVPPPSGLLARTN